MRVVVPCLLLVAMALAGCTGDKDSKDDGAATTTSSASTTSTAASSSTTGSSTATTSSSTTTTSGAPAPEPENRAPTGSVAVLVNGTAAKFNLTGLDLDDDALTWTLSFGDNSTPANGASLPASVNHTYAAAGNFTAVYRLSDGEDTTTYNLTVAVSSVAGAGLNVVAEVLTYCASCSDLLGFSGAFEVPIVGIPSVSWNAGEPGLDATFVELSANLVGLSYSATSTQGDPDGVFWSSCSPMGSYVGPILSVGPESGTVPTGAGCMVLWEYPPVDNLPVEPPIAITIVIA